MKAALFHGANQPLTIEEVELDNPLAREIVVRTVASGVCRSDLHFIDGLYPHPAPAVLGHEAAGIVEEVGEQVTSLQAGDHVIACLSVFCGNCEQCLTGHLTSAEAQRRGALPRTRRRSAFPAKTPRSISSSISLALRSGCSCTRTPS